MPRLLINPGTPQQWEASLKPGRNTLGRSPDCDIQLEHGSVSGTHCELAVTGDAIIVRDLGSTNGTFLNRAPVQETTLTPGQRLQLGGIEMELAPEVTSRPRAAPIAIRLATSPANASAAPATPAAPVAPPTAAPRIGLRVATHEPAAPPAPPPAIQPPEEYAAQATGPAKCKYHPKSLARYLCTQCQLNFCELCVTSRPGGAHTGRFCRRCSGECVALNVQLVREGAEKENFFSTLPTAFVYPFKGSGLTFLICGTFFFALVDFLGSYSLYLRMIYVAYTFAYVQRVIQSASQGTDEPAGWPDVSEIWGDIIVPCFQVLALLGVCFGPAIALAIFVIGTGTFASGNIGPEHLLLFLGAIVLGAIYYPMAFLAMAMYDSIAALNPLVVIPAIIKIPLEYLVVLVVTAIILILKLVQGYLMTLVSVPVIPNLITGGVGLYFLTVQGRLLGLMYFAKRDKLGWFHIRS